MSTTTPHCLHVCVNFMHLSRIGTKHNQIIQKTHYVYAVYGELIMFVHVHVTHKMCVIWHMHTCAHVRMYVTARWHDTYIFRLHGVLEHSCIHICIITYKWHIDMIFVCLIPNRCMCMYISHTIPILEHVHVHITQNVCIRACVLYKLHTRRRLCGCMHVYIRSYVEIYIHIYTHTYKHYIHSLLVPTYIPIHMYMCHHVLNGFFLCRGNQQRSQQAQEMREQLMGDDRYVCTCISYMYNICVSCTHIHVHVLQAHSERVGDDKFIRTSHANESMHVCVCARARAKHLLMPKNVLIRTKKSAYGR